MQDGRNNSQEDVTSEEWFDVVDENELFGWSETTPEEAVESMRRVNETLNGMFPASGSDSDSD